MIYFLRENNERVKIGLLILLVISTSLVLIVLGFFGYQGLCIQEITQKYFEEIQEEGYLSDNIKKGIINDISDVGKFYNISILGSDKEVSEGEDIFLSIEANNGYLVFIQNQMGIKKYKLD